MITVHHLENSRSQRILWLLEELEVDYEIQHYKRNPKTMLAPNSLKRIHPLGKSPIITDGDNTVAESGAIITYLLDHYDPENLFRPKVNTIERTHYTYWLHYAEGSMMPPLLIRLVFSRLSQPPVPLPFRPFGWMVAKGVDAAYLGAEINRHMDFMNTTLANQPWFVGDNFTAADIQMSFPLLATQSHLGKRPHIKAFLKRCQQRPAFKKAISKGGPITPV